ncbi:MAG: hypothetical protein JXM74_08325, partial [Fusobacteriaceae bacterium]|nr:hypothetical protein [Fusobacteriaceae bacterium]
MEGIRKVVVEGVVVNQLLDGDFEGTKWFQLREEQGIVKPKWKCTGSCYMRMVDEGVKEGDKLDLVVEMDFNTKMNSFVFGKV